MVKNRRRFSREFKIQLMRELEGTKTVAQLVREYEVDRAVIGRWYREHQQYGDKAFQGNGHLYKEDRRVADLERMVGQLAMENTFLKKALQRLEAERRERSSASRSREP